MKKKTKKTKKRKKGKEKEYKDKTVPEISSRVEGKVEIKVQRVRRQQKI